MSTTNPVSQVLIPTGNQAILGIGLRESSLAVGQLGIFNYHTGLSIDGTVLGDAQEIYFAVGVNRSGTATLEDIVRSSGQMIQRQNVKAITAKAYIAPLPKIMDITGYTAKCETDYIVKIEFRSQKSYGINGFNPFVKSYSYTTGCCITADCSSCPEGDCIELATGIVNAINNDPDKLVIASYYVMKITATVATPSTAIGTALVTVGTTPYSVPLTASETVTTAAAKIVAQINTQANSPYSASNVAGVISIYPKKAVAGSTETLVLTTAVTGLTITPIVAATFTAVTDPAAFATANSEACLSIRITGNPDVAPPYNCSIPIKYYNPRGTDFIISLVEGFACNGTTTLVQNIQYEEGAGEELQYLEYVDGGWNGKPGPYRVSAVTGLQRLGNETFAVKATKYSVFTFTYDQFSVAGWLEHLNNLETVIGIACADTVTIQGLFTMLDLIFAGRYQAMTNDVATFDCTNVSTDLINNYALDGIESVTS